MRNYTKEKYTSVLNLKILPSTNYPTFYKLSCINREVILGYNRLSKREKSAKNAGKQKLLP